MPELLNGLAAGDDGEGEPCLSLHFLASIGLQLWLRPLRLREVWGVLTSAQGEQLSAYVALECALCEVAVEPGSDTKRAAVELAMRRSIEATQRGMSLSEIAADNEKLFGAQ